MQCVTAILFTTGADFDESTSHANPRREPLSLLSAARLIYRGFTDHLAARRRSLSAAELPAGEDRAETVVVRPISVGEGLWIFGGSVAFSVAKVLGLSLLYYVAPEFVETWGPTFG